MNIFEDEKNFLVKTIKENIDLKIIYFSSILAGTVDSDYFNNKLNIEGIIKKLSNNYIIFRIPQIVGCGGNQNNLVNHIKNLIINNEEIKIDEKIERSLLDITDLTEIVNFCKDRVTCETINVSGIEKCKVTTICGFIGNILNKEPNIKILKYSEHLNWDIENSDIVNKFLSNVDNRNYTFKVLSKYIQK